MASRVPYKVWSADRVTRKAVVAESLEELVLKGKQKLAIEDAVTVVIEEDGTEVEDDEYFQCLQPNTVFLLLKLGESWHPPGQGPVDEPDFKHNSLHMNSEKTLAELAAILREDFGKIVAFSSEEIQIIVESDSETLKTLLGPQGKDVSLIQQYCQRHLDDRDRTMEAIQLLKMLSKSGESSSGSQQKRPRTE